MLKRLFFSFVAALLFGLPVLGFAHELEQVGNTVVLLHVDPDDNPIAGAPSRLHLEFRATGDAFQLAQCACQVRVSQSGREIPLQLSVTDERLAVASLVFPEKGVYQVTVSGTPKTGAAFAPFALDFSVRVARGGAVLPEQVEPLWKQYLALLKIHPALTTLLFFGAAVWLFAFWRTNNGKGVNA